uniref:Ferroptosis suppressor protein 1 n=1 Tax=Ciona intestinalis TaxID=7719 RepID=F6QAM3_CIOIN|nr:apoptosis-inducing factor 2 isoform X1 [Ciona intestinalis]|eukprot:XP_002129080.1 apoptosis-inducing factor 2 isoform X1 [Ciona intestinalis]
MGAGSSVTPRDDMHLVIVGGGYAGSYFAVQMIKSGLCKVTLIDGRDAMFHSVGALRTVVDEDYFKYLFIPYDKMLGDSFTQGEVSDLDTASKTLTLKDGKTVTYTHLVIATGSSSSAFPSKMAVDTSVEEAKKLYSEYRKEVVAAKRVLMVGGGAVGVELAGEIKTEFPDKEVTIVSSSDFLVTTRTKPAFQKNIMDCLVKKNITVIMNDRVSNLDDLTLNKHVEGQVVKTTGGKELTADLVVPCTGITVNNQFFKQALAGALTESGTLEVNEYFQVKGHKEIYAMGDVTNVNEEKMAYTAKIHADLIKSNLLAEASDQTRKPYPGARVAMVVPVGRTGGAGQFMGMQLGDFAVKMFKAEDLFAKSIWSDLGMKLPQ